MKILTITAFLILTASNSFAQKWHIGVRGGFGFPIQKDVVGSSGLSAFASGSEYVKNYETSFGKGIYSNIVAMREIDSISFVEAELRYWRSNTVNTVWQVHNITVTAPPYYVSRRKITANNIFLNFSYGIKYHIKSKLEFYGKIGVMVGQNFTREEVVDHNHGYYPRPEFEIVAKYKYQANYTIGFTSATGFNYRLNNRWKLNCEAFLQVAGARMLSRELVGYTADGKDIMSEVTPENRKTDFYYPKNKSIYDNSEASGKYPPKVNPLSSMGVTLGILYSL